MINKFIKSTTQLAGRLNAATKFSNYRPLVSQSVASAKKSIKRGATTTTSKASLTLTSELEEIVIGKMLGDLGN